MFKKRLIAALAVVGFLAGTAALVAQTISIPTQAVVHNTADLVQVIPNGTSVNVGNIYVTPAQISNAPWYVKVTPVATAQLITAAGYTNYFGQAQTNLIIILTATMPYSYAYAATAPSDGARECTTGSGGAITALSFIAASGQTVTGGNNISVTSNSSVCFTYSASNLVWDRS